MSLWIADLVNSIPRVQDLSWLELGVYLNWNFDRVQCGQKESVDVEHKPTYKMTTDEFFAQYGDKRSYDLVFIDADHMMPAVLRDYNNAIRVCRKCLFIHDLFPPDAYHTQANFCGDGYKLLAAFMSTPGVRFCCADGDFGLTLVFPPFVPVPEVENNLTYAAFRDAAKNLKRYNGNELRVVLRKEIWNESG